MTTVLALVGSLGLLLIYRGAVFAAPHRSRVSDALRALLDEAGLGMGPTRMLLLSGVIGLAVFIGIAGITASGAIGIAFALPCTWAPISYARARRARRRRAFRGAWPDALTALISSVRAGVSLPEACMSLSQRGPEALKEGFSAFGATYRATSSFDVSLQGLRAHLADPTADRVVVALSLAHDLGGTDLVRLLRSLCDFVREDERITREIEARWSWTITAARVAAVAPWIVLLMMSLRPEAAAAYNSRAGVVVIAVGAVATFLGYRLMLRAARLPDEGRLYR